LKAKNERSLAVATIGKRIYKRRRFLVAGWKLISATVFQRENNRHRLKSRSSMPNPANKEPFHKKIGFPPVKPFGSKDGSGILTVAYGAKSPRFK
jgi:hypothetical protein